MTAQSPDTTQVELPKFYEFIPSILAYLSDRTPRTNKEIYSAVAERYPLSNEQLRPNLPNGKRPVYVDRISWGLTYLKMFGAVDSPRRGQQVISDEGIKLIEAHPEGIPDDVVAHIVRSARSTRELPSLIVPSRTCRKPRRPLPRPLPSRLHPLRCLIAPRRNSLTKASRRLSPR